MQILQWFARWRWCAEEPVEDELVTEETEETLEQAVPEGTTAITPENGPDATMDDTAMTDTTITDEGAMDERD